jgi:hypothetical protein
VVVDVVTVGVDVGAVGRLTLAVLLVICVSVFEMLLAMLDAPPEPHPAIRTPSRPASAILTALTLIGLSHAVVLTLDSNPVESKR